MIHRILLLGAGGCWGQYLSDFIPSQTPHKVIPFDRHFDLNFAEDEIARLIAEHQPTCIVNLIGTFSGTSEECYKKNTLFPLSLMRAIRDTSLQLILVGSAAEYGMVKADDLPLRENHPLNPVSDYGISKAAQTFYMRQYAQQYGIDGRLVRVFNLVGPGLSERLAPGGFVRRIARLQSSGDRELIVGNLKPRRDYLGVSMATQMLIAVIEKGSAGEEYNICSGYSIPMEELVQTMLQKSGLDDVTLTIDPTLLKRFDVPDIYGSREKINTLLPELTDEALRETFDRDCDALLKSVGVVQKNMV